MTKTGPICLLLVGHTTGRKAIRLVDENLVVCFLKFDKITCNVYILVLNGFLAVIMYCTNLVLLRVFAVNNVVKAASFAAF